MRNFIPSSIPGFTDPFSSFTHLFIIPVFLVFAYLLLKKRQGHKGTLGYHLVYIFAVIFMFSMSGTYHLLDRESEARAVLRRLDYSGIFLLIAATFTPVHGILFRGFYRWGILLLIWLLGINGIIFISVFFESIPQWLSLTFFLSMGWIGLFSGYLIVTGYGWRFAVPLMQGALFYTIGAVLDYVRWPLLIEGVIAWHEVFHIFVILGVFAHFRFIYNFASPDYLSEWEKRIEPDHPPFDTVHYEFKKLPPEADLHAILNLQKGSVKIFNLGRNERGDTPHNHKHLEVVYMVMNGSGEIVLDDRNHPLKEGDFIRVSPWVKRSFSAGRKGLKLVAFGSSSRKRSYSTAFDDDIAVSTVT